MTTVTPERCCACGQPLPYSGRGRPRSRCDACKPTLAPDPDHVPPGCPLGRKQLRVVGMLGEGLTYQQIAHKLGISASTVRTHLHQAYARLDVIDRAQAVLACERAGWLDSPTARAERGREKVLLTGIKALLKHYVRELQIARRHRVSNAQYAYLQAFEAYLRAPSVVADDERDAMVDLLHVVLAEAAASRRCARSARSSE